MILAVSVDFLIVKFREYILSLVDGIPFSLILIFIGLVIAFYYNKWNLFLRLLLIEYIILIFSSTVFLRSTHSERFYNIMPFDNIEAIIYGTDSTQITEKVMNVIVFIPLGAQLSFNVKNGGR